MSQFDQDVDLTDKVVLAKVVHQMLNTESTETRNTIQAKLSVISEADDLQHARILVEILVDSENPELKDMKLSVALYLKNVYRIISAIGHNQVHKDKTLEHINILFTCIKSEHLQLKAKVNITQAYEQMLILYRYQENEQAQLSQNILNILQSISQQIADSSANLVPESLKTCFMLTESMFALMEQEINQLAVKICVEKLFETIDRIQTIVCTDIFALNTQLGEDQLQLNVENQKVTSILQKMDVMSAFMSMILRILGRLTSKQQYDPSYIGFVTSRELSQIFIRTFSFGVQIPHSPNNMTVISITGLQVLDNQINQLKTRALECMNYIIKHKDKRCDVEMAKDNHQVIKGIQPLLPVVLQSLIICGQRSDLQLIIEEETISNFIIELLELNHCITQYEQFKAIFLQYLPNLILNVCFQMIKTTETERQQMFDNPQEFVSLALDTCDRQKSYIIKTQAAKLIEALCDNIDGAVTLITFFCVDSLNFTLSKESGKEALSLGEFSININENHQQLCQSSIFMQHSKPDVIIDAAITVLGLLSYVHSKNQFKNIFSIMESTLNYYIDEIINNDSKLVRVRYALFLGYLVDMLYKDKDDAFRDTIYFLYRSVNLKGEDKAIALQSIDTLKTVTCDQDLFPRIQKANLLPEMIKMIQESIHNIQNHEYLDFIQDFIQTYGDAIDGPELSMIIAAITQRITVEMSKNEESDSGRMFVQKCFNLIKQATQNKNMMQKHAHIYEQTLIPIFEYMTDPTKITFEDDICLILKNFIRKTNGLSDIIFKVFPCLELVFRKNKYTFGETLLDTLNWYLVYGSERIMANRDYIQMLFRIADEALFSTEPTVTTNNSEGAIFLQIVFQIFQGTNVLDEFFENILDRVILRMKGPNQLPVKPVLKKHLLQVFLSAIMYNPSATLRYLDGKQLTKEVVVSLINLKKEFRSQYERKMFILGLTSILNVDAAPAQIQDPSTMAKFIQECLAMLNKVQKKEASKAKKKAQKQIHSDSSSDGVDSSYGDSDDESSQNEVIESEDGEQQAADKNGPKKTNGGDDPDMMDTEDVKQEGNEAKNKTESDDDDDDSDENEFELAILLDTIKVPLQKADEFSKFSQAVKDLSQKRPNDIPLIVNLLNDSQKELLKKFLKTKRVIVGPGQQADNTLGPENMSQVPRQIVKITRRKKN